MNILVTGGSGFIGANLCAELLNSGHHVTALDNFYSSQKNNLSDLITHPHFQLIEHDILEPLNFTPTFQQIYHLACPASPPKYQRDHIYTLRTCFEGTLNLLNFAIQHPAKPAFLFSSTSEVYGDPQIHPQPETYRGHVNPHGLRSCYDEGKRVAESLCMNFYRQHHLNLKIVRIFNTYGPKMDPHDGRVISNFITQALQDQPLTIYGDGSQTRSFQYIDDLLAGMIAYMNFNENFPGTINLGNPHEFTILELAQQILQATGKQLPLNYQPLPSDDPLQRCPDISLAKEKLDWQPKINLQEGIAKSLAYFEHHID